VARSKSLELLDTLYSCKIQRKFKLKNARHFLLPPWLFFILNFPACRVYLVGFNEEVPGSRKRGVNTATSSHSLFFTCSFCLIPIPCSFIMLWIYVPRNCIRLVEGEGMRGKSATSQSHDRRHILSRETLHDAGNVVLAVSLL
jgi:hypothetical protein